MKSIEHYPKAPSSHIGVLALLADLLAGCWRRALTPLLVLVFVSGMILSLCNAPALAASPVNFLAASSFATTLEPALTHSNPPQIRSELVEENVHATRAEIEAEVESEGHPLKWRGEYAENLAGPWTAAGGATIEGGSAGADGISLGTRDPGLENITVLHHLKPATQYYARFIVESEYPTVSKTFEFTTLPAGKPEIAHEHDEERLPHKDSLVERFPTTAAFMIPLETNGAETKYSLEYTSTPEVSSSWMPGPSGSIGVSEDFANVETKLTGLTPETTYYVRIKVSNEHGVEEVRQFVGGNPGPHADESESFTTPTARPDVSPPLVRNITPSTARLSQTIGTNYIGTPGLETNWRYEYATSPSSATWTTAATGTISASQAAGGIEAGGILFTNVATTLNGLQPGTHYFVRLFAENPYGAAVTEAEEFTTSGAPTAVTFATHALHGEALRLLGTVDPGSAPTSDEQTIAIGGAPTGGTFTLTFEGHTTGAGATVSTTSGSKQVALVAISAGVFVEGELVSGPGIAPGSTVTSVITPQEAEVRTKQGDPTSPALGLSQPATATATGVAIAANLAYDTSSQDVTDALQALPGEPTVQVEGSSGGPYTVFFVGRDEGVSEPQMSADGSGLTPSGSTVTVQTSQEGGVGTDAHYHFEYVPKAQFEASGAEGGFAKAASTPAVDIGSGDSAKFVGQDLPGLTGGETYAYRIAATNTAPGNPVVHGATQTFTAPVPATVEQTDCPNAPSRTGASAGLPDCRAYEQVTPVDKEGSEELFQYGDGVDNLVFVGEDGNHLALEASTVNYGSGPGAGGSPYLFSRNPEKGWQMTAGSPQPATGLARLEPALFSSDLTQLAFFSQVQTSGNETVLSKEGNNEYKYGPVGGPYVDAASVPRSYPANKEVKANWVGASADFTKLFLQNFDHSLAGSTTSTKNGEDIYEYSAGRVRQVNVGVGTCGAKIARGEEGVAPFAISSPHAVSSDGSRVFFEAVPGNECSQPSQLYMRVNASKTIDIGPYRFFAANAQGTRVLLERRSGEAEEIFLYETESSASQPKLLLTVPQALVSNESYVSSDLSSLYFVFKGSLTPEAPAVAGSALDLYHYDVTDEKLSFIAQLDPPGKTSAYRIFEVSPDGRYLYFNDTVADVPAGATGAPEQVFLYDSAEDSIECVSCASSFAPEPKRNANLGDRGDVAAESGGRGATENNTPPLTLMSANGDFAFFDTSAALVPQDIDGEQEPSTYGDNPGAEFSSSEFSPSSDVYEWRRDGIDGCAQLQGCLALISSGRGGVLNLLLGSTPTGNDVFIYTKAQLTPSDTDNAGDIYDVRVGGGLPPPPPTPVECEADACSTPPSAPNDPTQTLLPAGAPPTEASKSTVAKKAVKCTKGKRLSHGKCVKPKAKSKRRAKRSKHAGSKRRAK